MRQIVFNRRLSKEKSDIKKAKILHFKQDADNWCWAATAELLLKYEKNVSQKQSKIVNDFLLNIKSNKCVYFDCIYSGSRKPLPSLNYPLCPTCNIKLLNWKISNRIFKYSQITSYQAIRGTISDYKPIEFVCQTLNNKNAHYSVIYGTFGLMYENQKQNFLMISDPLENGVGVAEFNSFRKSGKYCRSAIQNGYLSRYWIGTIE